MTVSLFLQSDVDGGFERISTLEKELSSATEMHLKVQQELQEQTSQLKADMTSQKDSMKLKHDQLTAEVSELKVLNEELERNEAERSHDVSRSNEFNKKLKERVKVIHEDFLDI